MLGLLLAAGLLAGPADQVSEDDRRRLVEAVAATVEKEYVDTEVAGRAAAALREGLRDGRYASGASPAALAALLTQDLFAASRDKHLGVTPAPEAGPAAGPPDPERERARVARRSNFGVARVEVLPGNVGYLDLTTFYRASEARETLAAAMRVLRNADALVVDLRENGGGAPDGVALLASYFFDAAGLELFEIVPRSGEGRKSYRTLDVVPPDAVGKRPTYLLTSARTFSAGEGFAFLLQERHRAEVVGETTAGAANPGRPYPLPLGLAVTVPNSRVRSAVSGRNWEGVGVVPDVPAGSPDALRVARVRALRALLATTPAGSWRERLESELARERDTASGR